MNALRISRLALARHTPPRPPASVLCRATHPWIQCRAVSYETRNQEAGAVKPRESTPLRRAAKASLPIRSNPTPTRSDIQQVTTLATAERFLLTRLRKYLPAEAQNLADAVWVPRWGAPGKEGEVFVFDNGSFVCWGLDEDEARRFGKEIISKAGAQVAPLKEPETEELDFVTDHKEYVPPTSIACSPRSTFIRHRNTRLQGDLIILGHCPSLAEEHTLPTSISSASLPRETLLARYAFSQALSRSTALSALEVSLDNYLSSVAQLPHSLAKTGKPGMDRVEVIKKLGLLLKFRQGLNLNRENFSDTPDFYWAEPVLEGRTALLCDSSVLWY